MLAREQLTELAKTPVELEADELDLDRSDGKVSARGEVRIVQEGILDLQADSATYDLTAQKLNARGMIRITRKGAVFQGDAIELDVANDAGEVENARIDMPGPGGRATASAAQLHNAKRMTLKDATFTNCDCEDPPWYISASKIEVDDEKNSVSARDVTLRLGGVPIAYTPWWTQPLRKERKSGFLTPSFQVSDSTGYELDLPYYWNIAPDRDATLTLHPTTRRGVMGKVQYRYKGQNYHGELETHGIHDTELEMFRGLLVFDHQHAMGPWRLESHVAASRTNDFLVDFEQDLLDPNTRHLQSSLSAKRLMARRGGHTAIEAGVNWFQDLTVDTNRDTVQQLPYVALSDSRLLPGMTRRLRLESGARLDHFYQMSGDRAQRGDLSAKLRYTQPLHIGRISLAAGGEETAYWTQRGPVQAGGNDEDDFNNRIASMLSARLDLNLSRNYEWGNGGALRHAIEPTVQYVLNAATDQSIIPNYDSRSPVTATDDTLRAFNATNLFAENQFAGIDRISSGQWISYGVTQRFTGRRSADGPVENLATFTIGQRWAPAGDRDYQDGNSVSDIVADLSLNISDQWSVEADTRFDPHKKLLEVADTEVIYRWDEGQAALGYQVNRPETTEVNRDVTFNSSWRFAKEWKWEQEAGYSMEHRNLKSWRTGLTYIHDCWNLKVVGGRRLSADANTHEGGYMGVVLSFEGLGSFGVN
ncbi:putative organic solvent tolerance protein [Magnetofaba australis IT-1]|uniref:LPS-assembly protein LptD n=1 Tax=Magnetofaba australis IT-1 TaxID=1434232 RepID=A0A1Y2K6T8_9PROT|nr:putative organic solvent tolerance protein [Magnetofaba australis IT-1]